MSELKVPTCLICKALNHSPTGATVTATASV